MSDFYVQDQVTQQLRQWISFEGSVRSLSVDYSSWADDNGTTTTATWSIESGSATISSEALASNVASALITTASSGPSTIKLSVTDGTHTSVIFIAVMAKNPRSLADNDYGFYSYG